MNDDDNFVFARNLHLFTTTSFNGERTATLQSLISLYQRQIKRSKREKLIYRSMISSQLAILEKIGITPENILLSPDPIVEREVKEEEKDPPKISKIYTSPQLQNYLSEVKKYKKMDEFFKQFPLIYCTFFDNKTDIDVLKIAETVQTWKIERRLDYFDNVWTNLNNIPYYLGSLFSLLEVDDYQLLAESVEAILPDTLSFSHAVLYSYSPQTSILTVEKQKLRMIHILKDGIVNQAIKQGNHVVFSFDDPNIRDDDLSCLGKHKMMAIIPIKDSNLVLGLFDKYGEYTPHDDLLTYATANILQQINHVVTLRKRKSERIKAFQGMSDIMLTLSGVHDMKNFLYTLSKSLESQFSCEHALLFRVSQQSASFWKLKVKDQKEQPKLSFSEGIVGYSISKKTSQVMYHPEHSVLFKPLCDRFDESTPTNSILVSPVFDSKDRVKWVLALYNKIKQPNFTEEDIASLEILCNQFHYIIQSVVSTSKITDEMRVSSKAMDDLNQAVDLVSYINNITDIPDLAEQVSRKMKSALGFDRVHLYTVDRHCQMVFGKDEDEFYIKSLTLDAEDSIVKFINENSIREKKALSGSSSTYVYCPVVGTNGSVVGLMVLTSDANNSQIASKSSMMFQSIISFSSSVSLSSSSKLAIKLAALNQKPNSSIGLVTNQRTKKVLGKWSTLIGTFLETGDETLKNQWTLLIEERSYDSFFNISAEQSWSIFTSISNRYTLKYRDEREETIILPCIKNNLELQKTYVSLVSILRQFPGDCDIIDHRRECSEEEMDDEFPSTFNDIMSEPIVLDFPSNNVFDVLSIDEKAINSGLTRMMKFLSVTEYLQLNNKQVDDLLIAIRKLHSSDKFHNWRLSVDHVQFLYHMCVSLGLLDKLSSAQKTALFLFLILLNTSYYKESKEIQIIQALQNDSCEIVLNKVFSAIAGNPTSAFFNASQETQTELFSLVSDLQNVTNCVECSIIPNILYLTAVISQFSYLARTFQVTQKWVKMRFDEELKEEAEEFRDDLMKYQLEFDTRVRLQTALSELSKLGYKVDTLRRAMTDNVSRLTNASY